MNSIHIDRKVSVFSYTIGVLLLGSNLIFYGTGVFVSGKLAVRIIAAVFLLVAYLFEVRNTKIKKSELFISFALVILTLYHGEASLNLLLVILVVVASREIGTTRSLQILLYCMTLLACFLCVLLITRTISDYSYVSTMGRYRRTLGFENPNQAAVFFAGLAVVLLEVIRRVSLPIKAICTIAMLYVAYATDSRGLLVFVAVFLVFKVFLFLVNKSNSGSVRLFAYRIAPVVLLIIIVGGSILLPVFSGTSIDALLSFRPTLFKEYLSSLSYQGWLFGSPIESSIDNFVLVSISSYGLPITVFFIAAIARRMFSLESMGDSSYLAFICSVICYSFIESFLFRPEVLITLAFWIVIFNDPSSSEDAKEENV